jgi:hypothetical protein
VGERVASIDDRLKTWATPYQVRLIDAINQHGGLVAAARSLGIDQGNASKSILTLRAKAAMHGWAPDHHMTNPAPPPFLVKGTSTFFDGEGNVKGQWVKTTVDNDLREAAIREFVEHLCQDARGLSPLIEPPAKLAGDFLALYGIGDPHFGMRSWAAETGADFDLAEAERLTCGAIDRLVIAAPEAGTALLLNAGDYTHADNNSNMTPGHGNILDVDTRHAKVMQVGLRAMVHAIKRLLQKHFRVIVWMMPGNHDPHTSFALAIALDAFFSNEPRVEIDLSPGLYKYLRFGKVLIGAHHGHGAKPADLPLIMATDRPEDWGATTSRYIYGGHIHHLTRKEWPGAVFETFRTLAPGDAWHSGKGYRAGRDMQLIVHHKEWGEVERHRCDVGMLGAA